MAKTRRKNSPHSPQRSRARRGGHPRWAKMLNGLRLFGDKEALLTKGEKGKKTSLLAALLNA